MWSFYLNGGAAAVIKNLGRDGFQCKLPDGSLVTWHTTKKEANYLEGHFLTVDGTKKSHQAMHWHDEEIDKVSYYSPDSESPYLTYSCRRATSDIVDVIREGSKKVDYQVIVISKDEKGRVTHYRCLIPEGGTWEVTLTYNILEHLIREDISTPDGKAALEYEYDDHGVLVLQRFITEEKAA